MILPVLFFTLAFSLTFAVAAENFLLGKWLLSAYLVPSFYPTVINCNAEENPLPIAYTVKTLQNRTDFVRFIVFVIHVYLGLTITHFIPQSYLLYAVSLLASPILYYRRPIAVLIENHPYGASPVTYKQYIEDKNAEMVPLIQKDLGGIFTTPPDKDTIVRALNMCNYDKEKTVDSLKNNTTEVNRKDEEDNFFWSTHDNMNTIVEYKTKRVEKDNYNSETSYRQQSLFAEKVTRMLNEYRIPLKSLVFVSGDPLVGNEYATYCRVPPEKDSGYVPPMLKNYEEWFDKHVSGSSFMSAISFGPMSTIAYGIDASPNTKVCLLSQTWLWDKELSIYQESKNVLNNTEAAIRYTKHAWTSIHISDETVYYDSDSIKYLGDSIEECIEDYEEKHGFMDSVSKEYLCKNAKFGTHELVFPAEEEDEIGYLQLPNFTSSVVLLNPLSLLKYVALRGNDIVLPLFPITLCYSTEKSSPQTDIRMSHKPSSMFVTAPENISLQRAIHDIILDTNMRPSRLSKDDLQNVEEVDADDEESSLESEEESSIEEEPEEDLVTIETKKNV